MPVRPAQPAKARAPISSTPGGTITSPPGPVYFTSVPSSITKFFRSSIRFPLFPPGLRGVCFCVLGGAGQRMILALQPTKAYSSRMVTLSGIVMLVRLAQAKKASGPISVTLSGIVMLARLRQY